MIKKKVKGTFVKLTPVYRLHTTVKGINFFQVSVWGDINWNPLLADALVPGRHGWHCTSKWRQILVGLNHCVDPILWFKNNQENHCRNDSSSLLRTIQHSYQLSQKTQWYLNIQTSTMHQPTHHMLRLNQWWKQLIVSYRPNHVYSSQNVPINPKVNAERTIMDDCFVNTNNPSGDCS